MEDIQRRPPSRAFCPRCGQKYKVPEDELRQRPGLRFRAVCSVCHTPFAVVWKDGDLQTEVEEFLEEERGERDPLRRGTRVGKYEIEDLLDSGGSSSVYKAFEPGANRYVALKLLHRPADSEFGVRFRREVEVQANLKHPNLMPIFDQGEVDGRPYYTMELLHKPTTLETIVALFRGGRLGYNPSLRTFNSVEALLRHVILPVAGAIDFANTRHRIVHRDLKPDNVIVDGRTLRNYVIDFGICHVLKQTGGRLILRAGAIESGISDSGDKPFAMGTLRFMPPEQAKGGVSSQGDVWALGALVHHILTGDAPISRALDLRRVKLDKRIANLEKIAASCRESGDDDEAAFYDARLAELRAGEIRTLRDVLRDAQEGSYVPLPDDTDPVLAAIVRHAMDPDPEKRYATAEEFASDVRGWLDGRPARAYAETLSKPAAAIYRSRLFLRRHRTPFLAAGAVLLVIGIAGLVQLATSSSRAEQRIVEWMAEARSSPDPSIQKVRANQVLLLEPGHKEATEILAAAHVFAPLLTKVDEARNVRNRMAKLLREQRETTERDPRYLERLAREVEAIERRAEEMAAVLELGVLPDLALLPANYSGRQLEDEVRQLANVLRGRRTVEVQDFPAGAEVLLVPPVARGEKVLAWDRSRSLGVVPLPKTEYSLDPGSYVLIFRRPGEKREILMPLRITRTTPPVLSIRCPLDPVELPDGMLYMAGVEDMEYGDARFYEKPRTVTIKPFLIDKTEVTNAMYAKFVNSVDPQRAQLVVPRRIGSSGARIPLWSSDNGGHWVYPEGSGDHPVTGISLSDARAYAQWIGKRLPSPEEWELAARGVDRREFPFGDGLDTSACNTDTGSVSPVGTYPRDRSPFGVLDLAGNVAEWTEDGSAGAEATLKGGSFDLPRFRAIVTSFLKRSAEIGYSDVGFRCALSLEDLKR